MIGQVCGKPFQHTDTLSSLGSCWIPNEWKLRGNSGIYHIFVCMFFWRWLLLVCALGVLDNVDLSCYLVQAGFYLSLVEKLFLSETRNAEVLGGMGAWAAVCAWWLSCGFALSEEEVQKKIMHKEGSAWLADQLWLQECLKSAWRQSASLPGFAGDLHIWMSCSWNLSLSVRQIVPRERPAL